MFRYDLETVPAAWKERGTGQCQILKHKASGLVRILMRRDNTMQICANHYSKISFHVIFWCHVCRYRLVFAKHIFLVFIFRMDSLQCTRFLFKICRQKKRNVCLFSKLIPLARCSPENGMHSVNIKLRYLCPLACHI